MPEAAAGSDSRSVVGAGVMAGAGAGAGALAVAAAVGGALIVLMVASLIVCYLRKRICVDAGKMQPVS